MNYLKKDANIEALILKLIKDFKLKANQHNIYDNVLDPFSSVIEASINDLNYDDWIKTEQARQHQKTLQNTIGNLHQKLLANIEGVQDLGVGEVVDIVCHNKKIIAEIKNKHNTTKGNHKKEIYDDMVSLLANKYIGYTGYYVEIIPNKPIAYNTPFVPSDNVTKVNRAERQDIRKIDGKSFYTLLTGDKNAMFKMYRFISEILVNKCSLKTSEQFKNLFYLAYGKN